MSGYILQGTVDNETVNSSKTYDREGKGVEVQVKNITWNCVHHYEQRCKVLAELTHFGNTEARTSRQMILVNLLLLNTGLCHGLAGHI